jgi:hypothetical protein
VAFSENAPEKRELQKRPGAPFTAFLIVFSLRFSGIRKFPYVYYIINRTLLLPGSTRFTLGIFHTFSLAFFLKVATKTLTKKTFEKPTKGQA